MPVCLNCVKQPMDNSVRHKFCVNDWGADPNNEGVLVKRPEPIRDCVCQHKPSWQYIIKSGDTRKNEGTVNGSGS